MSHHDERIEERRQKIQSALGANGVTKDDLREMSPDEVMTAVGEALLQHHPARIDPERYGGYNRYEELENAELPPDRDAREP